MLTNEIKKFLDEIVKEKVLIITIGNDFRSDDGVGPYIFEHLKDYSKNLSLLNAGDKPENIIDEAVALKPKKTIIIDAADFDGLPGEIRIIPQEFIPNSTLSTHTFPPNIIAKIIEEDTKSEVVFLGIQPVKVELGEVLSESVKKSADDLIKFIQGVYNA